MHLLHATRLDPSLLNLPFLLSLMPIVVSKVFFMTGDGRSEMRRLRVRVIQLSIIDKLVVATDVLTCLSALQVRCLVHGSHHRTHLQALLSCPRLHAVRKVKLVHGNVVEVAMIRTLTILLLAARCLRLQRRRVHIA